MLALLLSGATWFGGLFGRPGALGVVVFYIGYLILLAREDPPPPPESGLLTLPEPGEDRRMRPLAEPKRMPIRAVLARSAHWQRAAAFGLLASAFSAIWFWGFFTFAQDPPVQALRDAIWTHLMAAAANGAVAFTLSKRRPRE
ncbi:MAG: hypothetical protein FD126_1016 [Elusimicrobia bacterium]|nr:MAG: hypothetical protein FD126_1016 [Elusimicrobiota bacterium]